MSWLHSNVTYILIFILTLIIVTTSYVYIFYYNHRLSNNEEINTLRKVLFWGLTSSAIIISIIFCIYVSFRMFRPFAGVVATAVVAGAIPVIPSTSTMVTKTYTKDEMTKIRKEVISKYNRAKNGDYCDKKKGQLDDIKIKINNNEKIYSLIEDKDNTPESIYKLYKLVSSQLDRFLGN